MKKSDFIQIVKEFPNRKEMCQKSYDEIIDQYAYLVDFILISKRSRKHQLKGVLYIPGNDRELWERFISFSVIAQEYFSLYEMPEETIHAESILNKDSQKIARKLLGNLQEAIGDSGIQSFGGITLDEWREICHSEKKIFC